MNKKVYLSLAIASLLGTNAHAEGSFRDALQGGKFSAEIRNTLQLGSHTDVIAAPGPLNNSNTGSSAISAKYETAPFKGLKFGIGFQFGHDWELHDNETGGLPGEDDSRNSISATNLQQAYLDYTFPEGTTKTSIRLGRQDIISPLVMRGGLYPMMDAFDAAVVTNRDLPATTLKFMYIDNWSKRYGDDASLSPVQVDTDFDGPVWSAYLNNKSIAGLDIEAQWLSVDHDGFIGDPPTNVPPVGPYDTTFLALNYKIPGTAILVGAKYLTANYDNADDSNYWGVKAGTSFGGVKVGVAYTSVDDDNNLPGSLGHVPMFRSYANTATDAEFIAGVDAASINVGYGFGVPGLNASVVYAAWSQSDEGIANGRIDLDGAAELALDVKYVSQSIKGLFTRLQLSQVDYDLDNADSDMTLMRVTMNYKF